MSRPSRLARSIHFAFADPTPPVCCPQFILIYVFTSITFQNPCRVLCNPAAIASPRLFIPFPSAQCNLASCTMAVAIGKIIRTSQCFRCISARSRSYFSPASRYLSTSSSLRYHGTQKALQADLPADKYQRTTITEDVRTAASHENWPDPRALTPDSAETPDESIMDPTIRHFTVNFV